MTGVRSIDALAVDATTVRGLFPPGPLVFPVDAADLVALDAAVRSALGAFWVVSPERTEAHPGLGALERYVRERLPAFERALLAGRTPGTAETLAAAAGALGVPPAELTGRLRPVEVAGRLEIPAVAHAALTHAAARLAGLEALGAPAAVLDAVRRDALTACTPGWRPAFDPAAWIPDPAGVAATVDPGRWPARPPVVTADVSGLVLLAALCTVGPAARSVTVDGAALRWHALGDHRPGPDPGPVADGAVVVDLAVDPATVQRLEFTMVPAPLLAVALA